MRATPTLGWLVLLAAGCATRSVSPRTPAAVEAERVEVEPSAADVDPVEVEMRLARGSFASLHPELEPTLRAALAEETARCPGLRFVEGPEYTGSVVEHWVYEASTYLLLTVENAAVLRAHSAEGDPHLFVLWPGGEGRPMTGATLAFRAAEGAPMERAALLAAVQVGVRDAVQGVATAYGVACHSRP